MIHGSNDESYREQTEKLDEDPELEKAGPLVNIRPQHLTKGADDQFCIADHRRGCIADMGRKGIVHRRGIGPVC